MYFLKRNFKTIAVYMLSLGVIGTIVAFLIVGNTYNYEEYYSLSEPLSTTQEDELVIKLNQEVNSSFDNRLAVLNYSPESQYLQLTISGATSDEISSIRTQFNGLLENSDISYKENIDKTITPDNQIIFKIIIIILGLILGLILGVIHSIMDKRVRTDEDVDIYLNQKSLGIF